MARPIVQRPEVLWELGADVIPVGVSPNGRNINDNCGSTHPQTAAETVVAHGADLAICLDGDADRIILVDENGQVADGDQLMGLMAAGWAAEGRLAGNALVATVMSNLGLERFLNSLGHYAGAHGSGRSVCG
jgi:phosphoglucosamine mutase